MLTALIFALIVLITLAVVALFAMMGDLTSRVEAMANRSTNARGDSAVNDWATVLENFPTERPPAWWPAEFSHLPDIDQSVVIVLSTSCGSCAHFADGDLGSLSHLSPCLIISCPTPDRAREFLKRHPFESSQWPIYVDHMGDWSREQLGIDVSPSAVLFHRGQPISAFAMSSPASLAEVVAEATSSEEVA